MKSKSKTQSQKGGLTELYLQTGTYVKSFYTVMTMPSSVKIGAMQSSNPRIHHKIDWNLTVPKIIDERHRKPE